MVWVFVATGPSSLVLFQKWKTAREKKTHTHTNTFHMLFFCSWKLCAEQAPPKNKNDTRAMCWALEWEGVAFLFWTWRSELNILGKSLNITQEQKGLKPTKHGNDEVSHMYRVELLKKNIGHNQHEFKATNSKHIFILKYHLSMYETPYHYFLLGRQHLCWEVAPSTFTTCGMVW